MYESPYLFAMYHKILKNKFVLKLIEKLLQKFLHIMIKILVANEKDAFWTECLSEQPCYRMYKHCGRNQ